MSLFLVSLAVYSLFIGGLWSVVRYGLTPSKKEGLDRPPLALWLVAALALVLVIGIVAQERWVPSYDDAGYYQGCVYVAREMQPNFLTKGIRYLYHTIETEDYNALLCY